MSLISAIRAGLAGNDLSKRITASDAVSAGRTVVATASGAVYGGLAGGAIASGAVALGVASAPVTVPLAAASALFGFAASLFD